MMDVGDAAGDRILDRDHAEIGLAGAERGEGVLEGRAGHGSASGIGLADGEVRIGAGLALEDDFLASLLMAVGTRYCAASQRPSSVPRVSRSSGVSTPSGTLSTIATSMRMPASSARNCSSFSRCSSGEGGSFDEPLQRGAAIGIKADVMIERPVAGGRGGAGEIERAQAARRDRRADHLDHVRIGALLRLADLGGEGGDVDRRDRRAASSAARDVGRRERRQVALHIDDDSGRGRSDRPRRAPRRCGRSRRRWSARVITARPPAFSTAVAIVSHRSPPRPGRARPPRARRSTWTIIGRPAISASGLPGSRVAAMRAGIRDQDASVSPDARCGRAYTGCQRRGKPAICAPPRGPAVHPPPPLRASRSAMDSFELNKVLGAVLGTCLCLAVAEHRGRRDVRAAQAGEAGLRDRGQGASAGGKPGEQAPAEEPLPVRFWPAPTSSAARTSPRNAGLPHLRQGRARTASGPISTAWSAVRSASEAGFNYSAAMKAKSGNWTPEELDKFLTNPQRRWSRAPP